MPGWLDSGFMRHGVPTIAMTFFIIATATGLIESVLSENVNFEVFFIFALILLALGLPMLAFSAHSKEKHRAEEIIKTKNLHLNEVLENVAQGLCMFDADQRLIICNKRYASLYGLPPELVVPGTSFRQILVNRISRDIFSVEDREACIQDILDTVSGRTHTVMVQKLRDGRYISITYSPMAQGGWVGTHEDVTEQKKAEAVLIRHRDHLQDLVNEATEDLKAKARELESSLEKEKELNELQRQFVSMASHEFRTPLAIIDTTAQRIKRRADRNLLSPEDAGHRVEKIRGAVRRMTRLMESTLTAARMEEGKISVEIRPCDIGHSIREVCSRQQEIAHTHTITCRLDELPATIQADEGSLGQVLTNLLSNAVKYAPDAPDIEVRAHTEGNQVVISVRDNGVGIDEEDLGSIGERFFRAKTSTGMEGTGIGLNLVKMLVGLHDGAINVDSKKGEGSTFTISLPIAGPDLTEQQDNKVA